MGFPLYLGEWVGSVSTERSSRLCSPTNAPSTLSPCRRPSKRLLWMDTMTRRRRSCMKHSLLTPAKLIYWTIMNITPVDWLWLQSAFWIFAYWFTFLTVSNQRSEDWIRWSSRKQIETHQRRQNSIMATACRWPARSSKCTHHNLSTLARTLYWFWNIVVG